MYDLQDLYQEVVMDHNRRPRNFRRLENADRKAEGFNPFCGDQLTLYLKTKDGVIEEVGFQGVGCAISKASASMMTEAIKGKTLQEAQRLFEAFRQMVTRGVEGGYDSQLLGDLELLAGVTAYPVRIKCAILPWHTLEAALEGRAETVSTE